MKLKNGVDYSFRFDKGDQEEKGYYIEINSGEFEGVKFKYGKTSVEEDEQNSEAFLNFEYDIIYDNKLENLQENEEFKNHIGNILVSIIEENMKKEEE